MALTVPTELAVILPILAVNVTELAPAATAAEAGMVTNGEVEFKERVAPFAAA